MNFYFVIMAIGAVVILLIRMNKGFTNGFTEEAGNLFSIVAAFLSLYILTAVFSDFMNRHFTGLFSGIIMLIVVGLIYRVVRLFFGAANLIAKLPIISWINKALGLFIGLAEGFLILYIIEIFIRRYLLM